MLDEIITECDVEGDGILLLSEATACWELRETDEYMLNMMLKDSSATLDVYGTCGNLYSIQYADAEPFMGSETSLLWYTLEHRSWKFRAQLAISLLELIESIEHTPYGTLYQCDVHEANFGIVRVCMAIAISYYIIYLIPIIYLCPRLMADNEE